MPPIPPKRTVNVTKTPKPIGQSIVIPDSSITVGRKVVGNGTTSYKPTIRRPILKNKQIELLDILKSADGPLSAAMLGELAGSAPSNLASLTLGYLNDEKRKIKDERNGYLSLISLGYVRALELDIDGRSETVYMITQEGERALEDPRQLG